jgi:prepilin-type N-terminal cleavage/methylation domain-containing protein
MKRLNTQKGFTLVELAIVMTIIGLLIGGILKGQELMENARVTSTVAQVKSYSAAVTSFKDMYQSYPGDMSGAGTRLVGCPGTAGAACNPLTGAGNAGNNIVGLTTWASGGTWAAPGVVATSGTTAPANVDSEKYLFWSHLLLANLIGGVTDEGLNNAIAFAFGRTHPEAKISGGFIVGYGTGVIGPGSLQPAGTGISGTMLLQVVAPAAAVPVTASSNPLAPLRAAQIDRKMDDGRPGTGYVQAFGLGASCFTTATAGATQYTYNETIATKDCGLIYRIEG